MIHEHGYRLNSADNLFQYDLIYQHPEDERYAATSSYGIRIYKGGLFYKTAIVMATGGGTGVSEDSAVVSGGDYVVACCNKVFSLRLPDLGLNWIVVADMATCFGIYAYEDDYIIHGEVEITRLDRAGRIVWQVGARDIFVNIEHVGPTFLMHEGHIELMDWTGSKYKLFYDGRIEEQNLF